jgi:hypothetical protein
MTKKRKRMGNGTPGEAEGARRATGGAPGRGAELEVKDLSGPGRREPDTKATRALAWRRAAMAREGVSDGSLRWCSESSESEAP